MSADPHASPDAPLAASDIAWSGITDIGRFRPNNEDTFLALKFDGHEVNYLGKDGHASLSAPTSCSRWRLGLERRPFGGIREQDHGRQDHAPAAAQLPALRCGDGGGFSDVLLELFSAIHADLVRLGQSYAECAGMGATLSLCWFRPDWMYFGHVGDSRIYYLPREGGMTQVTHDHSHVGWLRRKGNLNEREARTHPGRNALQQALGAGSQFVEPHVGAVAHRPGDRFLLITPDGLIRGCGDQRIEEIVRYPLAGAGGPTAAQRLVDESVQNSGRDNTTAVVIDIPCRLGGRKADEDPLCLQDAEAGANRPRTVYSISPPGTPCSSPGIRIGPQTCDYIGMIFNDFVELHGDRAIGDDRAIRAGCALGDHRVMLIGHQKGHNLQERNECLYGCGSSRGYRKAASAA